MRVIACLFLLLAACNREEKPEGPTAADSERLDQAEQMLNGLANEEGPANKSADPSINSD